MDFLRSAALAALCVTATCGTALAHNGVMHNGCAYGQSFTTGTITVTGAFIPAVPKGAPTAAAYLTIANAGDADSLTGATSAAGSIGLHKMSMEGNVMKMAAVEGSLAIPAQGTLSFDPMGYHLMMTGMTQPFAEGQCVEMVLHFAKAGDLPIELNIGAMGSKVAPTARPDGTSSPMPAMDMPSMDMGDMSSMSGM